MNLIVICLDTFRADMVGPGHKFSFVETPNLDDFAAQSVVFDRAFGEGQPTLQIRRAFFTGRRSFPWRYNFDRRGHWHHAPGWHKIPPDQDTLAEILLQRGYLTGMVADCYHMFKPTMNFWRGCASYEFIRGQESDNWKCGSPSLVEDQMKRHVREPINWKRHATLYQYLLNQRFRQSEDDYQCARVFRTAADWLESAANFGPFFLWVDSFDPHEPWDPPQAYADKYAPGYSGRDFIFPGAAWENGPPSDEEIERIKALYFGEVTLVDHWVGHLFEKLDELKLWDDTIVMVTCDHGTHINDHGGFGKGGGNMRPYNTQLIWFVRHPDGPRGKHINAFVQSHDLMPTCLDLLDVPYVTDGESAWPLVTGAKQKLRDEIVIGWANWADGRAAGFASVRDDQWAYTTAVGGAPHLADFVPKLYHLPTDSGEDQNVAEQHPDIVARCRRSIEAVMGAPLPGTFEEVCDRQAPAPGCYLLQKRL